MRVAGSSGWPWIVSAAAGAVTAGVIAGILQTRGPDDAAPDRGSGAPVVGSEESPASGGSDPTPQETVDIIAVGDIASCESEGDEATAALARATTGTILALGDLAYDKGTQQEFVECYDPSWGRLRDRTRPVPGNHEYRSPGAAPYFDYFGDQAGTPGEGWYSYDLGTWHVVALNSNCEDVECGPGSPQEQWLRSDLQAADARCTLAYWHHPPFSSGERHGGSKDVLALWRALHENGVDVLLSSHEHSYERFAPLGADGEVDLDGGVRSFVAGTGGRSHYPFAEPVNGSESRIAGVDGVLRLSLAPGLYAWEFVPVPSGTGTDAGTGKCR